MSWQCHLCETFNNDDTAVCEVCNAISPFLAWFKYDYEGDNIAILSWLTENTHQIEIVYNQKSHNVTTWKAARIKLGNPVSFIVFKLKNDTAERVYTFGIPNKNEQHQ